MDMFGRKIDTNEEKIESILNRGVSKVAVREDLKKELLSGRQLCVKLGIDPTSKDIHLGRSTQLLKLRDFQELGHKIVFILGDFTGIIGDTSDKESERPMLTENEIEENQKTYFEQVGKIIDLEKAETRRNSEWLSKLTYKDIGEQADQFSVADFISRDNIKNRLDKGTRVSLREVLYPLMQGYDSVAIEADVEIGGTDQWFNLLAGRPLQEHYGQKPQNIVTTKLISGLDGRKMSSSWGNTINITDNPKDMFGKVMSMGDDLVDDYFVLCTRVSLPDIEMMKKDREVGKLHPRDMKKNLAREIVSLYYGGKEAVKAGKQFTEIFNGRGLPEDVKEVKVKSGSLLDDVLLEAGVVKSKNEFRRLVRDGGVSVVNGGKINDNNFTIDKNIDVKVGKRRFLKITVST